MSELAELTIEGAVATLTLQRENKRNALSEDLIEAATARLGEVRTHEGVRALVLAGAGRSFCAGMDLAAVLDEPGAPQRLLEGIAELTIALSELDAVVIAAVQGAAIGGGCGLVCACDLAVTHAEAKLGFPEVDLGVCPAVVAPWVHRALGASRARRVLLSGGTFTGVRAGELGLVGEVVEQAQDVLPRARELANSVAEGGSAALAATKRLLGELDGPRLHDLVRSGAALSAEVLAGDEAQTRLRAVMQR